MNRNYLVEARNAIETLEHLQRALDLATLLSGYLPDGHEWVPDLGDLGSDPSISPKSLIRVLQSGLEAHQFLDESLSRYLGGDSEYTLPVPRHVWNEIEDFLGFCQDE